MDWSCVPPVLEADDDNRDDDDEFQIRKEGEGNADEKEFFISR